MPHPGTTALLTANLAHLAERLRTTKPRPVAAAASVRQSAGAAVLTGT